MPLLLRSCTTSPMIACYWLHGSTINTLRLWPHQLRLLRLQSSAAATSSALTETLAADSLTRVLYPHDSTSTACPRMGIGQIYLSAGGIQETSKVRTEKGVLVDTIRKNRQLLSVAKR